MRPPWRRAKSGTDTAPASSTDTTQSTYIINTNNTTANDSCSDESLLVPPVPAPSSSSAGTVTSPFQRHVSPLKRLSGIFKDPDGRYDENLKSMKRRVIQVRRQPDSAPIRLQMGFRSRTGWEPIRATKENQDCLIALVPWGPNSTYNLFAALDGHGRHGHQCAIFIAQKVIYYLERTLLRSTINPDKDSIARTLHKAIIYAERKLESPNMPIDFQLSGSTGVFTLIHGCTLFCANVGDSRAIIGREIESHVVHGRRSQADGFAPEHTSKPLMKKSLSNSNTVRTVRYAPVAVSIDQKPSRPDEKERLLAAGARVDAWEGIDVGQERVWLQKARIPGLAVSRSFGDILVKEYGVSAIPEIYQLELCEEDRFIVLASDGVFEFMSSVEVIEVVGRMRDASTCQEAAEELVRISTERWIEDDSVIDDISCIVVYMNVIATEVSGAREPFLVEISKGTADTTGERDNCASSRHISRTQAEQENVLSPTEVLNEQRIDERPAEPDPFFEVLHDDGNGDGFSGIDSRGTDIDDLL